MVFTSFYKVSSTFDKSFFRFVKNSLTFLIKNKSFFNRNRRFSSTSENKNSTSANISSENYIKNFYSSKGKDIRKYHKSFLKACPRYSSLLVPEILFSRYSHIKSQNSEAVNIVEKELLDLSYDELLEEINLFLSGIKYPIAEKEKQLIEILDSELSRREENFSKDDILNILMTLTSSRISLAKLFQFYWKKFKKLTYKLENCSLEQAVIYFYIYFKHSFDPGRQEKFRFLDAINKLIPQLNEQELGIVFLSLSRSNFTITHPEILDNLIKRTVSNIECFTSEDIYCISEFIYKKGSHKKCSLGLKWQENLILNLPNYESHSLSSIALSCEKIKCLSSTLFDEVIRLLKENFEEWNAVIINRMVMLFVSYNKKDDEFLEMAIKKFSENLDQCSPHLVQFVKNLICLGRYEKKLIEVVMSDKYLADVLRCKSSSYTLDFLYVDSSVRIDNSFCDVPVRNNTIFKKLEKYYCSSKNKIFKPYKMWSWLDNFYTSFMIKYPMKHFAWVYIMRLDKNLNFQPIPEEYISRKDTMLRPLNDDHFWVAIVIARQSQSADNYALQTSCRQLKALGYEPVKIYFQDWFYHLEKNQEKEYFENQIVTTLKKELKNS